MLYFMHHVLIGRFFDFSFHIGKNTNHGSKSFPLGVVYHSNSLVHFLRYRYRRRPHLYSREVAQH